MIVWFFIVCCSNINVCVYVIWVLDLVVMVYRCVCCLCIIICKFEGFDFNVECDILKYKCLLDLKCNFLFKILELNCI